ncbi:MAG: M48 family metalloprotease [Solirubrobacterales bacterium]
MAARVGGAAVAMVVAAEVAGWLLSPRDEIPDPVPVSERDYFTPVELERAHDYSSGQRLLGLAGLGIEAAVLVVIAVNPPRPVRRALERVGARPVAGAAAAGAGVALVVAVATLPTGLIAHHRAVGAGLSDQSSGAWLWDVARSTAITAGFAAIGAALLLALVRRLPRSWWVPAAAGATLLAVVFTWLAPVVLAPIFNKFEPLPDSSRARADVLELGRRAGVDIGEVYRVDASRRTNTLNAYVDGIGSSRRVVLYDNLLERADRPELDSVVAHELGHVAHDDIVRGLAMVAIVAPFGMLFARELAGAITRRRGVDPGSPAAVPIYVLAFAVAGFALAIPGDQLSRRVEASADQFALELTDDPRALIQVQRRLSRASLGDPDPPAVLHFLFGTHPTTVQRIGAALAFERDLSEPETTPR